MPEINITGYKARIRNDFPALSDPTARDAVRNIEREKVTA